MSVIDEIVRELHELPPAELQKVARYVHELKPGTREGSQTKLMEMAGCMADEDGADFERAVQEISRQADAVSRK